MQKDITSEVILKKEKDNFLIQQSKMASIGEMIGAIAHQWRQPLNVLSLIANNIKFDLTDKEINQKRTEEALDNILMQVNFMSQTIGDFKNFFEPNKKLRVFSIEESIKDILKLVGFSFLKENINIEIERSCDDFITGYPNEFKQVILNILNNSKDAILTNRDRGVIDSTKFDKIDIYIYREKDRVVVEFQDYAGGVDEKVLSKVFDYHFSTKGKDGTGVGMYISKIIIDKVDGEINIFNKRGGASVLISFPVNF